MALLGLLLSSVVAAQAQDLDDARRLRLAGDYAGAIEMLTALTVSTEPTEAVDERLELADVLFETGNDRAAEALLRPLAGERVAIPAAMARLAQVQADRGELEPALELLSQVVEREPVTPRARLLHAEVADRLGRHSEARTALETLVGEYESGQIQGGDNLADVAEAYYRLQRIEDAHATFSAAVNADADSIRARLGWARLLLDKYRPDQAEELAEEVLRINPSHPQAKIVLARAGLVLDRDTTTARRLAREALAVNPSLASAHELLAELALHDEDYEGALEALEPALDHNPNRAETLALAAAAHFLGDAERAFRRVERRVLELDPTHAAFYARVADFASGHYRYDDAVELYTRALELDSDYWPAYLGLGIGLSRQGDDELALQYLRRALEWDPFNARAYRLVRLYDEVLGDYERVDGEHIRFRFHRRERPVLAAYMPPLLDAVFERYVERYGLEPEGPISIEVYADPEAFAIRSTGSPMVEPHGICFGRLITTLSPSQSDFNWAAALAHELSHVFTLQLSRARVPRWLGEGLADYDASLIDSAWRRNSDYQLMVALRDERLVSVANLNRAFRDDDPLAVDVAYHQSALAVEFIVTEWGDEAPLEMLRRFAEGERLDEVLRAVTALDVESFDAAFQTYLRTRLSSLLAAFEPVPELYRDEPRFVQQALANPDDPQVLAELAMAEFWALRIDECEAAFERALAIDPDNPLANFLAASFALRERRFDDARALFQRILDAGLDGYTLRTELAELARLQGRSSEAVMHYQRALQFFPAGVDPRRELADISLRAGDHQAAVEQLQAVADLDHHDDRSLQTLLRLLIADDRLDAAWQTCQRLFHIDPFLPSAHTRCGSVAARRADWAAARTELELAISLGAEDRLAAYRNLLDVYTALGEAELADQARSHLDTLD